MKASLPEQAQTNQQMNEQSLFEKRCCAHTHALQVQLGGSCQTWAQSLLANQEQQPVGFAPAFPARSSLNRLILRKKIICKELAKTTAKR